MIPYHQNRNIILASGSPRRKYLLENTGLKFTVIQGDVSEDYPDGMSPEDVAVYLSEKKAEYFSYALDDSETLLITADTLVVTDDMILGKPMTYQDAMAMLQKLSGKKHSVITGVTIKSLNKTVSFTSITDVYFKALTDAEITYYLDNYKPFDKAGAYGIQEWIGYIAIERIEGSYFNVVGLPVQQLYHELMKF
jgi:septum formation protein